MCEELIPQAGAVNNMSDVPVTHDWPMAARYFFLTLPKNHNKHFEGKLTHAFYKFPIGFQGLDEAILYMNKIMDELECPQTSCILRDFRTKRERKKQTKAGRSEENEEIWQKREQAYQRYWNKDFTQPPFTAQSVVQIEVRYRQNASWQGTVTIIAPKSTKKENFRSVLELMNLIYSARPQILSE